MMKPGRGLLLTLFFFLIIGIPFGGRAAERLTVTDLASRTVSVPLGPRRIICLGPGCLRLLCYLGAEGRLVGVEGFEKTSAIGRSYRYAKPSILGLPVIGPGGPAAINKEPDLEAVIGVKPDIIFITYMEPGKADALQQKLGVPVIVLSYGRIGIFGEELYQSLRLMGKVLDREKRADAILSFIDVARKDLAHRAQPYDRTKKPGVYVGGIGFQGSYGIESTEADYAPLEWVKARNVAKGLNQSGNQTSHLFLNKEKLLVLDPDVIFLDGGGLAFVDADYQERPEFYRGLRPFRDNRVYVLWPFNMYATNIDTVLADAYAAGKILYPSAFAGVDLNKKTNEIFSFFVGQSVRDPMVKDYGELGSPWKKKQ